jgi:hypothetical protein
MNAVRPFKTSVFPTGHRITFRKNVRDLSCSLRHRKFITLLISLEESIFFTGELMLEVRIQDTHTIILTTSIILFYVFQ